MIRQREAHGPCILVPPNSTLVQADGRSMKTWHLEKYPPSMLQKHNGNLCIDIRRQQQNRS